ncbi:hypothetical protein HZY97_00735 [Sphingomonas sp. R-74633]|uniref:hypothetical protein n=1 Tax=Sphingomonas sp. R-74633 TaxID=2751188 RepID=UPI0015D45059|nr:hypothetical protein [Sphingomonas sp. R-74633]NYT39270.1 hypothetical protein [Sphingomonas sp. R-74633]
MATDFAKTMARLPDEALFDIAHPDIGEDYAPEAIAAARAEIGRRGISEEEGRQIRYDIFQEREERLPPAEEPLSKAGRIASMAFSICLGPMLFVILMLFFLGYREKALNTAAYMAIGLMGYFCLGIAALTLVWLLS